MLRSRQGHLSVSVPSGGLCTDLQQWIQAPACLGSPGLPLPLSFCLPRGPELWGHPTPLSPCQRDSLTDPHHLWVEGLVQPLEISSLKPARICSSWCCGHGRAGLGSASAARRTFCERFAGPSGTEISFAPLFCGLTAPVFAVSYFIQMFYGLWVRSNVYVHLSTLPSWLHHQIWYFLSE